MKGNIELDLREVGVRMKTEAYLNNSEVVDWSNDIHSVRTVLFHEFGHSFSYMFCGGAGFVFSTT